MEDYVSCLANCIPCSSQYALAFARLMMLTKQASILFQTESTMQIICALYFAWFKSPVIKNSINGSRERASVCELKIMGHNLKNSYLDAF